MDEMHGHPIPHGENVWGEDFGNVTSLHGYDTWYVHEHDVPLTEEEVVKDWQPPAWAWSPPAGWRAWTGWRKHER